MILEIPDEYREAFIGFLVLGLTYLDQQEDKCRNKGRELILEEDELAVIEIVNRFIEQEECG